MFCHGVEAAQANWTSYSYVRKMGPLYLGKQKSSTIGNLTTQGQEGIPDELPSIPVLSPKDMGPRF